MILHLTSTFYYLRWWVNKHTAVKSCPQYAHLLLHGFTLLHITIILICSSLQGQLRMESQDGKFTIQNVTRHMSDLICQPFWNSSNQHLKNLTATLHLTVDCESSSLSITYIFIHFSTHCELRLMKVNMGLLKLLKYIIPAWPNSS